MSQIILLANDKPTDKKVKEILIKEGCSFLDALVKYEGIYMSQKDKREFEDVKEKLKYWIFIDSVKEDNQGLISEVTLRLPEEEYLKFDIKFVKIASTWQISQIKMKQQDKELPWMPFKMFYEIARSNFRIAFLKGKIKTAMIDLRDIGNAVETYLTDYYEVPEGKSVMDLKSKLEPFYIKKLPVKDPWGNDYLYLYGGGEHRDIYSIGCSGRDGVFKGWHQSGTFPMDQIENFNNDIIFSNGTFTLRLQIK
jgi:hypothetical protein